MGTETIQEELKTGVPRCQIQRRYYYCNSFRITDHCCTAAEAGPARYTAVVCLWIVDPSCLQEQPRANIATSTVKLAALHRLNITTDICCSGFKSCVLFVSQLVGGQTHPCRRLRSAAGEAAQTQSNYLFHDSLKGTTPAR